MKSLFPFVLLLCSLAGLEPLIAGATADQAAPPVNPGAMTPAEIRAHNKVLDRSHPDYIRCERSAATGSLVGTRRVCRTNARWHAVLSRRSG